MTVSGKGEYALRAIFDLAAQNSGQPVKIAGVSKRQRIPQKFLEAILAGLKQGGFVESRRGADGGYLLARPANTITVGEVLRFVEGAGGTRQGKRRAETPFTEMWSAVDGAISGVLDHTTFADLVRRWTERQAQYVPNWDI